jgi:hypothetical protein
MHWDANVSLAQGITTAALPAGNDALQCATTAVTENCIKESGPGRNLNISEHDVVAGAQPKVS